MTPVSEWRWMSIFHVRFWVPIALGWAIIYFFLSFVPLLGPFLNVLPAFVLALPAFATALFLISRRNAPHFECPHCGRRMNDGFTTCYRCTRVSS